MRKQLDDFLNLLIRERGLSENTIEAYRSDLSQYLAFLMNRASCKTWTDVTEVVVMNYLYHLKDQGCAPATLARKAAAMRGLHRYLMRSHQMVNDPAYALDLPKIKQKPLPSMLTVNQVDQLLAAPDTRTRTGKRDRAMLEVLYATGMRVSECIRLDRDQVNLDLEFIRCVGKKGDERILPLDLKAIQALRSYITELDHEPALKKSEQPLFLNRLNKRLTRQGIWKILKQYAEEAEISIPISPETLRQSLTAHLLQNGASFEFIDELMGRTHHSASMRYPRPNRLPFKKLYTTYHPRVRSK